MNWKSYVVLFAAIVALLAVPLSCVEQSDAASPEGFEVYSDETVNVTSGNSVDLSILVLNKSGNSYLFDAKEIDSDGIRITYSYDGKVIRPEDSYVHMTAHISVDKYAHKNIYSKIIVFDVIDDSGNEYTYEHPINVDVYSVYSPGNSFNKILGLFAIPGIDSPIANAAITFVLWILITVAATLISRLLIRIAFKNEEERKIAQNKLGLTWFGIIMIYGIYNTMLVGGADEHVVEVFWDVFQFFYILLVAFIAWNIYKAVIVHFFTRTEKDGRVDTSLIPLFSMIGKIVIICVGTAVFLAGIGVNIAGIITGAGIVGLAVSLGAQNTLTELFSGFTLMITRPFIKTDMVRIGGGEDVYEVVNVGLLNTEFKAWGNTSHIYMPNSIVAKSKITNITKTTEIYRVFIFIETSYDADMEVLKQVMIDAANENPHVIKDGTYDAPAVRLTEFADSGIVFRLAAYVDSFDDNGSIAGEIRQEIYRKMTEKGLEMPYQKIDVRIERR